MQTLDAPVLDRLLDPISRALTPEMAKALVSYRVDDQTQAKLDLLARKCNEGQLSDAERAEYETYVHALDFIAVLQSKARTLLKKSAS